ncbi:DinB family protein [Granulicoccus sp. GXG6511]|uniref:DinB family protein n=1 Tax=Granulicoccus sp. GXG6511 TaxID=3381351 RepID=UPI003D7D6724
MQAPTLPAALEQLDWHWTNHLRPRLDGLTDDEYTWEPVPNSWNVRPKGTGASPMAAGAGDFEIDWEMPEPSPSPVTTIAWRLGHVIVGVLAMRNAGHFGGPETDYFQWEYAGTAREALEQLDTEYAAWIAGVRSLGEDGLAAPCGEAEGPWSDEPMITLVLHINRELIHHGAEIALLRDLYAHR